MCVCGGGGGGGGVTEFSFDCVLVLCFALGCVHQSGEIAPKRVHYYYYYHFYLQVDADDAGIHTGVSGHPRVPEGKKLYPDGQVSLSLCAMTVMVVIVKVKGCTSSGVYVHCIYSHAR